MSLSLLENLKYGAIGLGGVFGLLSYALLAAEHRKASTPRKAILRSIYGFMAFAVLLVAMGFGSELVSRSTEHRYKDVSVISSALDRNYFAGTWRIIDGHDQDYDAFKARYNYSGELSGSVEGGELILEGNVDTIAKASGALVGTARLIARGPINNDFVAAYYTYRNTNVNGFGSSLIQFDNSGHGTMHIVFRITRPQPGQALVGAAKLIIEKTKGTGHP